MKHGVSPNHNWEDYGRHKFRELNKEADHLANEGRIGIINGSNGIDLRIHEKPTHVIGRFDGSYRDGTAGAGLTIDCSWKSRSKGNRDTVKPGFIRVLEAGYSVQVIEEDDKGNNSMNAEMTACELLIEHIQKILNETANYDDQHSESSGN